MFYFIYFLGTDSFITILAYSGIYYCFFSPSFLMTSGGCNPGLDSNQHVTEGMFNISLPKFSSPNHFNKYICLFVFILGLT